MEFPGHILTWNSFTPAVDLLKALNLALGLALPKFDGSFYYVFMEDSPGPFLSPCHAKQTVLPSLSL